MSVPLSDFDQIYVLQSLHGIGDATGGGISTNAIHAVIRCTRPGGRISATAILIPATTITDIRAKTSRVDWARENISHHLDEQRLLAYKKEDKS